MALARNPLTIAVDAMGGDYAPSEVVKGAVEFARGGTAEILLVGDPCRIKAELASLDAGSDLPVRIHPATQIIAMDESPAAAIQEKPDASIVVCAQLVRDGLAQAAFSAGNTGAVMAAGITRMEKIAGVRRPAIATMMPTENGGRVVVVDVGANVDCKPSHMVQFALLGSIYCERVLGITAPRVGLLANGEEDSKGNAVTREVFPTLRASRLNFIGNVEGNHVFEGRADVIVCDGFVGNVLLKTAEGTVRMVLSLLAADARAENDEIIREKLLSSLLRSRQQVDYSEFGGAPLLGLNGVSFVAHGRSDARAISNGIRMAATAAASGYIGAVRDAIKEFHA